MTLSITSANLRLPPADSQMLDRNKVVEFTFDGKRYSAYEGDTIASALAAGGVTTFTRSFKYHRRRGLLCVSGDCPNCLVQIADEPNVRSCTTPVEQGMAVASQNVWPSLDRDIMNLTERVGRFLPAGFYYKTFMRPKALWPVYERVLRGAAGLGKVDERSQSAYFDKAYKHADVLVIGGGPAGLQATLAAARQGARVLLLEEQPALGGHLRYSNEMIGDRPAFRYAEELTNALQALENVELLLNTNAFGRYDHNWIGAVQGDRLLKLRTRALVIATGAVEIPPLFENNDLPGIMLASGVRRLLHLWGVLAGQGAVVASANRRGLQTALELLGAGVTVAAVSEMREQPDADLVAALQSAGVQVFPQTVIAGAAGGKRVEKVELRSLTDGVTHEQKCDLLVLATGYMPNNGLLFQAGGKLRWDERLNEFLPGVLPPDVFAAGEVAGASTITDLEREGELAGLGAAIYAGFGDDAAGQRQAALQSEVAQAATTREPRTAFHLHQRAAKKDFVCICEDVTRKEVKQSIDEGYDSMELLKRFSTISMGPCQGRMCNMAAMHLCAHYNGQTVAQTGTTTSRPPARPVSMGVLGGRLLEPMRVSAVHEWHQQHGAHWMIAGLWKRPEHYGDPVAEVRAVRERVGLIDVSTLGKLHLRGADVPTLLERLYTNRWQKLGVGRVRYGVMVSDEGVIMDDGVTARLADDFYYMTATSGGVANIYEWIEWWLQSGWDYDAHVLNATDLRAALNIAGPHSRAVLEKITDGVHLSNDAFPYMHARQGSVAGAPALLLRLGFTGELSYEIHVPSGYALHVWEAIMQAGGEFGIAPFGVEAQRTLRLEKGHIIVGQDSDGLTNPLEAGMQWAVKFEKEDFLGRPSLVAINERGLENKLVGFEIPDGTLPEEANQIVRPGDGPLGLEIIGRITSVRRSPTLNKVLGLCWLPVAMAEPGQKFTVRVRGELVTGRVAELPFYDPEGAKLRS